MLNTLYRKHGAQLAPDGIPLHFGDLQAEYHAALNGAILLDRSHEGRLILTGAGRFDLLNRMSTNNTLNLAEGEGRATIFTNANARILDRVTIHQQSTDALWVLTPPARGDAVLRYLQSNIFYNDDVQVASIAHETHVFGLYGQTADQHIAEFIPQALQAETNSIFTGMIADVDVTVVRSIPFVGSSWYVITSKPDAHTVWDALVSAGVRPSGGIIYNALRIRAGIPAVGFELTQNYIPLELGLWDEISFNKGCYTGQEIIARMESRNKLAKMLVRLHLPHMIAHGTELFYSGKRVGEITSSVTAPDGEVYAMGTVKTDSARSGITLNAGSADGASVQVGDVLGVQPMVQ
jgi:folate-binding protein YgfZ